MSQPEAPRIPHRSFGRRLAGAGGALALTGSLVAGCDSVPGQRLEFGPKSQMFVICNQLRVSFLDKAKHTIEAATDYKLAKGTVFTGITYLFSGDSSSVFVSAAESQTGHIIHEFPLLPTAQTDTITAVIGATDTNGHESSGEMQVCKTSVDFNEPN